MPRAEPLGGSQTPCGRRCTSLPVQLGWGMASMLGLLSIRTFRAHPFPSSARRRTWPFPSEVSVAWYAIGCSAVNDSRAAVCWIDGRDTGLIRPFWLRAARRSAGYWTRTLGFVPDRLPARCLGKPPVGGKVFRAPVPSRRTCKRRSSLHPVAFRPRTKNRERNRCPRRAGRWRWSFLSDALFGQVVENLVPCLR